MTFFNRCVVSQVGIEQPLEEVMEQMKEEGSASPKCMGPGCSNDALPGSVYCGHQCILRHAAVAMKSLSEPKTETKPTAPPAEPALKVIISSITDPFLWSVVPNIMPVLQRECVCSLSSNGRNSKL